MTDIALKAQDEILSFDVSDEALEVAAGATRIGASFTLGSCTGLSECPGWPMHPTALLERPPRGGLSVLADIRFGTRQTFQSISMSAFRGKADNRSVAN
jgi:hypothetical protein